MKQKICRRRNSKGTKHQQRRCACWANACVGANREQGRRRSARPATRRSADPPLWSGLVVLRVKLILRSHLRGSSLDFVVKTQIIGTSTFQKFVKNHRISGTKVRDSTLHDSSVYLGSYYPSITGSSSSIGERRCIRKEKIFKKNTCRTFRPRWDMPHVLSLCHVGDKQSWLNKALLNFLPRSSSFPTHMARQSTARLFRLTGRRTIVTHKRIRCRQRMGARGANLHRKGSKNIIVFCLLEPLDRFNFNHGRLLPFFLLEQTEQCSESHA